MNKIAIGIVLIGSLGLGNFISSNNIPKVDISNSFKGELIQKDNIKYTNLISAIDLEKRFNEQKKLNEIKFKKQKKEKVQKSKKENIECINITLTFYTSLPSENGGYTVTCKGKKLEYGMVASNYYKLGTKLKLGDLGTFEIADRGSDNFNIPTRLDVFIPKQEGESNSHYLKRVNNMGRKTVKAYIIK